MNTKTTSSAARPTPTRYVISYTIRDGDNEYEETIQAEFGHEPSEEELVLAVAGNYWWDLTDDVKNEVLGEWNREYMAGRKDARFTIPGDYRIVEDIVAVKEPQHRVLIAVCGGVTKYATDQEVDVCRINWDTNPSKKVPAEFADLQRRLRQVC